MTSELNNQEKGLMKKGLERLIQDLEQKLYELSIYQELKRTQDLLKKITDEEQHEVSFHELLTTTVASGKYPEYSPSWTASKKAEYFLRLSGKPQRTSWIVDQILGKEPILNRRQVTSNISAVIGQKAIVNNVFNRILDNSGEYLYGLVEWNKQEEKKKESVDS